MTVYSGLPSSVYQGQVTPGDVYIITGPINNSPQQGFNLSGTTAYMVSVNGSRPSISGLGFGLGNVVVHALGQRADGTYETTNASLSFGRGGGAIGGVLVVGAIGVNQQLAEGNLIIGYAGAGGGAGPVHLGPAYVEPGSSLTIQEGRGSGYNPISFSDTVVNGGNLDAAADVHGGNFDLEAYLSDPFRQTTGVATFQGGLDAQSFHVGYGSQLNLGEPLAVHAAISEDPFSQVVLRGTTADSFSYANGLLSVVHNGVQVADLAIKPTGGANGFSVTQIGDAAVISAVGLTAQQLASASMPTPVLHG